MKSYTIGYLVSLLMTISSLCLAQSEPFVPADFVVPTMLENQHFRIRTLTVNDVVKDYDAVMTSREHLLGVFGPNDTWPEANLTFEQDLIDLGWHQKEFQIRSSFAFTVVSLDEERVLGCIYIFPASASDHDAEIIMWVRSDIVDGGYDTILFDTVSDWVKQDWPFENPGYPGRTIDWQQWLSL
ncbi:MAG: hypothetical protein ACI95C_002262 [Pseudohongiellaceae bacterium]|jgi:hypothetical protein